jgi:hypothetical protein
MTQLQKTISAVVDQLWVDVLFAGGQLDFARVLRGNGVSAGGWRNDRIAPPAKTNKLPESKPRKDAT